MTSGLRRCSVPAREILWRYNGASNVYIVKVRTVNPGHVLRRSARQTDARARARKRIFFTQHLRARVCRRYVITGRM